MPDGTAGRSSLLIVLKGYPRISETFIAQELLGLEQVGIDFEIVSLRQPYDPIRHPIHDRIAAPVRYLPERLREEPRRVAAALLGLCAGRGFRTALGRFIADFLRDPTALRVRCFGQALVLAAEAPKERIWVHAHFAHTPASVARYAALIRGAGLSISAHAKDIWTSPDWELREKLDEARWTVTCTQTGLARLNEVAPGSALHLVYHGLDLERFGTAEVEHSARDGRDAGDPVRLLSVGRAVPKKGYGTLLAALRELPEELNWRFEHIGGGVELDRLKAEAERLGLAARVDWRGMQDQTEVLAAYRRSDIFVLASRETGDKDRDGLPNVLVEAASQGLACVATDFSAIPELIEDGRTGLLVPPDDAAALAGALAQAIGDPTMRHEMGQAAAERVRREFDVRPGIRKLARLFEAGWRAD